MGKSVCRTKYFPDPVFEHSQAFVGTGPNPLAVDQHAIHVVIRQAVCSGEVLPTEQRQFLGRRGRDQDNQPESGKPQSAFHKVFRYSMRSFSSSLVKSLVTPCVSLGLKTVQISSRERAEPSCR